MPRRRQLGRGHRRHGGAARRHHGRPIGRRERAGGRRGVERPARNRRDDDDGVAANLELGVACRRRGRQELREPVGVEREPEPSGDGAHVDEGSQHGGLERGGCRPDDDRARAAGETLDPSCQRSRLRRRDSRLEHPPRHAQRSRERLQTGGKGVPVDREPGSRVSDGDAVAADDHLGVACRYRRPEPPRERRDGGSVDGPRQAQRRAARRADGVEEDAEAIHTGCVHRSGHARPRTESVSRWCGRSCAARRRAPARRRPSAHVSRPPAPRRQATSRPQRHRPPAPRRAAARRRHSAPAQGHPRPTRRRSHPPPPRRLDDGAAPPRRPPETPTPSPEPHYPKVNT